MRKAKVIPLKDGSVKTRSTIDYLFASDLLHLIDRREKETLDSVFINIKSTESYDVFVSRLFAAMRPGSSLFVPVEHEDTFIRCAKLYFTQQDEEVIIDEKECVVFVK